ncbi:MAG: AIR synthase related protein [Candidatus Heimdallarchaeaceae archaeon]
MKEGKLPIPKLSEILELKGAKNEGIISAGIIGHDVAVIDIQSAKQNALKFYNSKSKVLLIEKSDPITFPTPNPGHYSVIVNSNDIACSGGVPYGFLITIIAPPDTTFDKIKAIQKEIHKQCEKFDISILGGHTEISQSVNTIIISGHMIGFVPKEFLVPNYLSPGDKIIALGYSGKEGTNILIEEAGEAIYDKFTKKEIYEWKERNSDISILNIALELNKEFKPKLLHDPTEGGIFGALYEIVALTKLGIMLDRLPPLSDVTKKLSEWLNFNPYRLISSGGLIIAAEEKKALKIVEFLKMKKYPVEMIGTVITSDKKLIYKEKEIHPPEGDDIIIALNNLNKRK